MAELRARGLLCPLCEDLESGVDGLYALAYRIYSRVRGRVKRGEVSWRSLPAAERKAMGEVVSVMTECAGQRHIHAQATLASLCYFGHGLQQDRSRAFELYMEAAKAGVRVGRATDSPHVTPR